MKAVVLLEVPDESIGTMCSVTYVTPDNKVVQEPCRLLGYEQIEIDIKSGVEI